jgi:hypothetical protein
VGFPPCLLHLARKDFRALPCRPLALACSEHDFEIACLLLDLPNSANAEFDDATSAAIVSDRTAAQKPMCDRMFPSIAAKQVDRFGF